MNELAIGIVARGDGPSPEENELKELLNLPLLEANSDASVDLDYFLKLERQGLTLYSSAENAPGGLWVDFNASALDRRAMDGLRKQNIGKAVGLKADRIPTVLDATAGLGTDGFLLASGGCELTLLERNRIVAALLRDGISRAQVAAGRVAQCAQKMTLINADFLELNIAPEQYEVIFLDPMFPHSGKSARAKKPMQILQGLLGHGQDEPALLHKALELAGRRVVVKRGKHSPALAGRTPDISFRGNSNRFDVYLIH